VTVHRNATPYVRTGSVAINGQKVTISQAAGQIPNLEPIFGAIPECNYNTLTPNWGAELSILTTRRFRQWMNDQPVKTWIDPWFDSEGIGNAVRRGLESWGAGTGGRLGHLEYTNDRTESHLTVAPGDFVFPWLAEVHQNGDGVLISDATIYFSTYFFELSKCVAGNSCETLAQKVAAHELGHAWGGGEGHTMRTESIMQLTTEDRIPFYPTQTDLNTMRTAYECR
jgi:hypothetical protein